MKSYWYVYMGALMSYLIFCTAWIGFHHTMAPLPKIVYTSLAMGTLLFYAGYTAKRVTGKTWMMICILPVSLFLWALVVDAYIGLVFHSDVFYMSENTWPDKQLLVTVQNGVIYTIFKSIGFIGTLPLLRLIR